MRFKILVSILIVLFPLSAFAAGSSSVKGSYSTVPGQEFKYDGKATLLQNNLKELRCVLKLKAPLIRNSQKIDVKLLPKISYLNLFNDLTSFATI